MKISDVRRAHELLTQCKLIRELMSLANIDDVHPAAAGAWKLVRVQDGSEDTIPVDPEDAQDLLRATLTRIESRLTDELGIDLEETQ